jgi:hypothetical protein
MIQPLHLAQRDEHGWASPVLHDRMLNVTGNSRRSDHRAVHSNSLDLLCYYYLITI